MSLCQDKIAKPEDKLVLEESNIVSGPYQCMLCDCGAFKEGFDVQICICGHTFYDHRSFKKYDYAQFCSCNSTEVAMRA